MLLCLWAGALCLGLLVGFSLSVSVWPLAASAAVWLLLLAGAWRRGLRVLAVAGAFAGAGVGLGVRAVAPGTAGHALDGKREVAVSGRWVRTLRWAGAGAAARGLIEVERLDEVVTPARAAVTILTGPVPLPGDVIGLRARLSPPRGLANPGLPDAGLQARAQGFDLVGTGRE